jgi:MFS family permease
MSFLSNNNSEFLSARITKKGRNSIAKGDFNISYFQVGDSEFDYNNPFTGLTGKVAGLSVGLLIGGIWVLKVKIGRPLFLAMILIALSAVWDFALAFDVPMFFSVIAAVLSGVSLEVFMVTWNTSLQSHVPEESYSRVSSYDTLGSFGIAPLGIVIAGPLAMHFGVNTILFVTGATTLIAAVASLLVPSVRNLRND